MWLSHVITNINTFYVILFYGSRVNVFPGCTLWLWLTGDQFHISGISCTTPWLPLWCAFIVFLQISTPLQSFVSTFSFPTLCLWPHTSCSRLLWTVCHMGEWFFSKKFTISIILVINSHCIKLIYLLQLYSSNRSNLTYRYMVKWMGSSKNFLLPSTLLLWPLL